MPPRKSGYRVTKTAIVDLLNEQVRLSADNIECSGPAMDLLQCYSLYPTPPEGQFDFPNCRGEERNLALCEMGMRNRSSNKLRQDMKRSLIFNMLRLSNFTKKIA